VKSAPVHIRAIQAIVAIGICLVAARIGSAFTLPAIPTWYASLAKPALTPEAWVFAPVWTVLYTLIGVALYLVWSKGWKQNGVPVAVGVFGVQLFLNVLWSYAFFVLQAPFLALTVILLLWIAILLTIVAFYRVSTPAAALLIPYLIWVTFAAYLNHGIYILNP
jgi:tryptophan-rich sensory protein